MVAKEGSCFLDNISRVLAVRQATDRLVHRVDEAALARGAHREPEFARRRHGHAVHHGWGLGALVLAVEHLRFPTGYLTNSLPKHRLKKTPSFGLLRCIPDLERTHAAIQLPL